MAANRALVRASLRGLLRAARRYDAAGVPLAAEVAAFTLPAGVPVPSPGAAVAASSFRSVVLHNFRANMAVAPGRAADALVDVALNSLALANKRLAALDAAASKSATVDTKPAEVRFSVGQVIRHKMYGYRAVIIGWDERCAASSKWVAATGTARLPHGAAQPFYHCLVDVRDRPDAQISYVAQDNVELMTAVAGAPVSSAGIHASPLDRMVIHPLITRHFDSFRVGEGYYLPTATSRRSYPSETPLVVRAAMAAGGGVGPSSASRGDDSDSDGEGAATAPRRTKAATVFA